MFSQRALPTDWPQASLRAAAEQLWGHTSIATSPAPAALGFAAAPATPSSMNSGSATASIPKLPSMQAKEADAMRAAAGALWSQMGPRRTVGWLRFTSRDDRARCSLAAAP